jgi:uncharacterized DUF497 family protein
VAYSIGVAQWTFLDWLLVWILETSYFEFDWDAGNSTKNSTKHDLLIEEIEFVFRSGKALPLGLQIAPDTGDEQRYGIVGPNSENRLIQVAFTLRNGKVRVISARMANKKERNRYEEILRKVTS